jgi:hypothetical protein
MTSLPCIYCEAQAGGDRVGGVTSPSRRAVRSADGTQGKRKGAELGFRPARLGRRGPNRSVRDFLCIALCPRSYQTCPVIPTNSPASCRSTASTSTAMTSRSSTVAPFLAVITIVLGLLLCGLYVGGYFWLGEHCVVQKISYVGDEEYLWPECPGRRFKSPWLAMLFKPMGRVESFYRGVDLEVISDN